MSKKIKWFARGGDIARSGPYDSQVKACAAMRQVEETDERYALACRDAAYYGILPRPRFQGGFPSDVFVWPEEVDE